MTRALRTAELLAIGTELTTGETLETNCATLARELTGLGVEVLRVSSVPDDLATVQEALATAIARADLVVTTGGLGPTPDDLTREAIAGVWGEAPQVEPRLLEGLEDLFARRGLPMADANRKQAWLIPSARALRNANGTAPGWWVEGNARLVVALPGPPGEMLPMWHDEVLSRLRSHGLGREYAETTLHLTGIGESALVDLIGEHVLRMRDPRVATYARPDAVDVRISATGASALGRVGTAARTLEERLRDYVFARDADGWVEAIGVRLGARRICLVEIGLDGELVALLAPAPWLVEARVARHASGDIREIARTAREAARAEVGLAVRARTRGADTAVTSAIAGDPVRRETRTVFLTGRAARQRAAAAACAFVWRSLESR
jgi:nicotinamide-nucleotide amidase